MSHFTVAVFTKEGQTIEELLAPYQENNMGDCPKEYLMFNDVEEEYIEKFETETRKEFYCNSSSSWGQEVDLDNFNILKQHNVEDKVILTIRKSFGFNYFKNGYEYKCYHNKEHKYPEEYIWIKVINIFPTNNLDKDVCFGGDIEVELIDSPKDIPLKEYYNNDFTLFMQEWAGYEEKDPKNNRYGYWENPNRKWDWYEVGGRFKELLKIKNGENKVNSSRVKDIDFSLSKKEYDENLRFWELVVEGNIPRDSKEEDIIKHCFYKPDYYLKRYDNKEQFAQLSTEFGAYAVITPDGKWHSKGDMGWWGCSSESDEAAKEWNKSFKEMFLETADPEWILTVVDCHI
jgi:hypothetical protein